MLVRSVKLNRYPLSESSTGHLRDVAAELSKRHRDRATRSAARPSEGRTARHQRRATGHRPSRANAQGGPPRSPPGHHRRFRSGTIFLSGTLAGGLTIDASRCAHASSASAFSS